MPLFSCKILSQSDGCVNTPLTQKPHTAPRLSATVTLLDGYNGHTIECDATPIDEDSACYKLRCAEPGREYLIRWVGKAEYEAALTAGGGAA